MSMSASIISAAVLGGGLTFCLLWLALRFDWGAVLDRRRREWHHGNGYPVPRLGGAALAVSFVLLELAIALFRPELRAGTPGRDLVVFASLAMFGLGFWDDLRPLGAWRKLLGQVLIAATVCYGGIGIEVCSLPFTTSIIHLGGWGPVVTVVWLVILTNLINLIDGVDGLAGGICFMLLVLIATVAHQNGNFEVLASGMAAAVLAFLCFNFPPARVYLGDGGAYFLGFQIGLYAIVNSHKGTVIAALVAPLFVLALPMADALVTLARRSLRGLPLFRPDRKHLHHRLVAVGCSRRKIVLWVYGLNLLFLLMGLAVFWSRGAWIPVLAGAAMLLLFACASTFQFSRRWFALHDVVRSSLSMRSQVKYALSLAHWLELESGRHSCRDDLWPDFIFAAQKLGFASVRLTCADVQRTWQRDDVATGARRHFTYANGICGTLEFSVPLCSLHDESLPPAAECTIRCARRFRGCRSNPQVFEMFSELMAEAWNKAAARLDGPHVRLPFNGRVRPVRNATQLGETGILCDGR